MRKLLFIFLTIVSLILSPIVYAEGPADEIIGTWFLINGEGVSDTVSFFNDGTYTHAAGGVAEDDGQPGMERGTFTWNETTGKITTVVQIDTNGGWGFSPSDATEVIEINGDTLVDHDDFGSDDVWTRLLTDNSNPIVGTWYGNDGSSFLWASFFSDGSYFLTQDSSNDPSGQDGMENGTYTWDSNTGAFLGNAFDDTNGEWGFSHTQNDNLKAEVSADSLLLSGTDDGGAYDFRLTRLRKVDLTPDIDTPLPTLKITETER